MQHTTQYTVSLFQKYGVYWLNCNQYLQKREKTKNKNRFSYKLTEITVVKKKQKKQPWLKKYIQLFFLLSLCQNLLTSSKEHVKATQKHVTIKINRPPLSNIKGRESLSYLECIKWGTSNEEGGQASASRIQIKITKKENKVTFLNPFGHSYCL